MTTTDATEAARALAARRPRITITCEVCGAEREVVAQTKQRTPRTCSARCRQALFRRNRAERHAIGTRRSS